MWQSAGGKEVDEGQFIGALDKFLSDCSARFPHWSKYLKLLDEIQGVGQDKSL